MPQLPMASICALHVLGPLLVGRTAAPALGGERVGAQGLEYHGHRLHRLGGLFWSSTLGLSIGAGGAVPRFTPFAVNGLHQVSIGHKNTLS